MSLRTTGMELPGAATFQDVRKVTEKVLRAFHSLPVHIGARDVERFVKSFNYIQEGVVNSQNLPKGWRKSYGVSTDDVTWSSMAEGEEIEIAVAEESSQTRSRN
jgi:hypothetical protein